MSLFAVLVVSTIAMSPSDSDAARPEDQSPIAQVMESLYSEVRTIPLNSKEFGGVVRRYAPALLEAVGGDCSAIGPALIEHMIKTCSNRSNDVRAQMMLQTPRVIYHFSCDTTVKLKSVLPMLTSDDKVLDGFRETLLNLYDLRAEQLYVPDYGNYRPYLASVSDFDPDARKLAEHMVKRDLLRGLETLVDVWVTNPKVKADWSTIMASLDFLQTDGMGAPSGPRLSKEDLLARTPVVERLSNRSEWWARLAAVRLLRRFDYWRSDERFARLMADEDPIVRKNAAELKYEIDFPKPPDYSVYPPEESRRLYRRLVESGMFTAEQLRHYGIEIEESEESIPDDSQENEDSAQPQSNG